MKTLYPPQQKALEFFVGAHQDNRNTLDSSMVGTGKTVVGCHLVRALNKPVGVVCPKSVLASWRRELEAHGLQPLFVLNYEKIRNGRTPWLTKTGKKAMRWQVPPDTLLIFDEVHKCLPEGTKVAIPDGAVEIQSLRVGDSVETPIGPRPVTAIWETGYKDILSFTTEKGDLNSSHDHKIFTEEDGWIRADEIREGHTVFMHPQELNSKNPRPEKRQATDRGWMESSTVEERRSLGLPRARVLRVSKVSQQKCWDIEVADASCFFAEGVLVHNCKGAFTQNAQLLIAARSQGIPAHMLSATACQDPTEMRALGYALGLHSLNSPTDGRYSWQGWMRKFGCAVDIWNSWYLRDKEKLVDLHGVLYGAGGVAKRLSVADFPTSFRENRVHLLPLECAGSVNNIFKNAGIGHQQLVDYILESETPEEEIENQDPFIVRLLRARQEAELVKVPEMSTLADDYLDDGTAVICFVNFRETAHALAERLGCAIIEGGQSADQRQKIVDDFQAGLTHSLVVNIEAGGTGLSLHHQSACARPRVSLISPTYNAKTHLQVLGRTHRNGALSDSLQLVVLAADSVEETVAAAIDRKCKMLATLHGIEYQPLNQ
jgi:hypothetical protein